MTIDPNQVAAKIDAYISDPTTKATDSKNVRWKRGISPVTLTRYAKLFPDWSIADEPALFAVDEMPDREGTASRGFLVTPKRILVQAPERGQAGFQTVALPTSDLAQVQAIKGWLNVGPRGFSCALDHVDAHRIQTLFAELGWGSLPATGSVQPAASGAMLKGFVSLVALGVFAWGFFHIDELVGAWNNRSLPKIEVVGTGAEFVTFADWAYDTHGRRLQAKMTFKGGAAISQFTYKALDASGVILENGTLSLPKLHPGDTGVVSTDSFFKDRPARVVITVE